MYIVGFNGPPESGKDTLAEMLMEHMEQQQVMASIKLESLSLPLRAIAYRTVGWRYDPLLTDEQNQYPRFKREWFLQLNSDGRHLMIDVSESFLKPCYGTDVLPKLLLTRNQGFHGVMLIRDMGFQCEVDPLIDAVGIDNTYIVRVHRAGKSFNHDSREWVMHPSQNHAMTVINNGTLEDLRIEAGRIYGRLVNQLGWKL